MNVCLKQLLFLCLFMVGLSGSAGAAGPSCKVFDPEIADEYVGGCKDGAADGEGAARGFAQYEGEFSAGKKHGRGRKTWPSGDSYEGQFSNDMREGEGIYRWQSAPWTGDFYWGGYRADKRHGRGIYSWANGDRFDGEWREDVRYGLSAAETQRQRAREAWMSGVGGVGGVVCSTRWVGLTHRQEIFGQVVSVDVDRVTVRLTKMPSLTELATSDESLLPGALVSGNFHEWHPCDENIN